MSMMNTLKIILIVQAFYAFAITSISYGLPADAINQVSIFQQSNPVDLNQTSSIIEEKLNQQINAPLVELGALLFYSGNAIIDFMLNFIFAVPEMITLIIYGVSLLFNLDPYLVTNLQLMMGGIITVLYMLGIMQLLANIRGGNTPI